MPYLRVLLLILVLPVGALATEFDGKHAVTLSQVLGSKSAHGHAAGVQCQWPQDLQKNTAAARCEFKDIRGELRQLNGIKAAFLIDSITGYGATKSVCAQGRCRLEQAQDFDCFTLGAKRFMLQCRTSASAEKSVPLNF